MRIKSIQNEIQIHYLLNAKQDSKLHHYDARFSFENETNLRFFGCFLKKNFTIEFNVTKTYIFIILNNLSHFDAPFIILRTYSSFLPALL